ncbi:MAG: hypothetical protein JRJ12_07305 [Deltaproteobacteria bacterium]|nr:hypothetical protein [Deltaproteobacteria bacterium]MBW2071237.1 hypothetical protein [Deltaproteobacteria bacterium]
MALSFLKKKITRRRPPEEPAIVKQRASFCEEGHARPCITVCSPANSCVCGCDDVRLALEKEIDARGLGIKLAAMKVGCKGDCPFGVLVGFPQKRFYYSGVTPERAGEIVAETLERGHILFDLLHVDPNNSIDATILYDRATGFLATIDDSFCVVNVAKYFLAFQEGVSCGKCVPCRVGSVELLELVEKIIAGRGAPEDLERMHLVCHAMQYAPYCDFARTTSGPIISLLTHFREEFEAHVESGICPAGVCAALSGEDKVASH